jgi:cytochrome c biogenesis protein CcmG/thiol:disulfide interchange protein DsbE
MRLLRVWAAVAVATLPAGASVAKLRVGDAAPHYVVRTFDKTDIDSADLRGQVVVINRWATWCVPCKAELPRLDAYYRAHATQGLRIFAVASEDSVADYKLRPLSAALAFPLAYRVRGGFPTLDGVPTNYVIDRTGIVRYAQAGAFDEKTLEAVLTPLLAAPAN